MMMKKTNRFSKAAVVIVIVGVGFLHNLENKNLYLQPLGLFNTQLDAEICTNDTVENKNNEFIIYTKYIIKRSIEHLMPKL